MAEGRIYVCDSCQAQVEAWSDGNPYLIDEHGKKRYAYHPDPDLDLCVGNDVPHLCLGCGLNFVVDSRRPSLTCPACKSGETCATYDLAGRRCPTCKSGRFAEDPRGGMIS
jgi:DNA-directed RNA polymerase subunit RPC12/RpoP